MSDTKFTPGPWRWNINPLTKRIDLRSTRGNTVMAFERWGMRSATPLFPVNGLLEKAPELSHIVQGREHHAEWFRGLNHPDANLIAAAPDLFEALEGLLSAYEDGADNCHCSRGGFAFEGPCFSCKAKDALAKARGVEA